MSSTWMDFLSSTRDSLARSLRIAASTCFTLAFGMVGPALAQTCPPANVGDTCPATGTAGFETGLQNLALLKLDKNGQNKNGAMVDWGDGTPQNIGLYRCFEPGKHPNECHVYGTHIYAAPGTYQIVIHYNEPRLIGVGPARTVGTTATISPLRDFVILSIGDSVASGEGDPVVEFGGLRGSQPNHGFWDDPGSDYDLQGGNEELEEIRRDCHRSLIAGPAEAAGVVAQTNPTTFVHFACSGATIYTRNKTKNSSTAVSQLRIARNHLPRIDVLLISAGANNMHFTKPNGDPGEGFGDVLERCLKLFDNCSDDPVFAQGLSDSLAGLRGEYAKLDDEIHCINPDDGTQEPNCSDPEKQIPKLVLITEYMDEAHVKRVDNPAEDGFPGFTCLDGGITENEWKFLYNNLVVPLNQQVRATPWQAVVGMQDDFMPHGYCAGGDRWIVTAPDSEAALGGGPINGGHGTGHPNGAGQADYRDHIYANMVEFNPPVTTASATIGSAPYVFGTWTNQDVVVTLSATNAIKESGVKQTLYAVDDTANCQPVTWPRCSIYGGPFTIGTPGKHTVTFDSQNKTGLMGPFQNVQVWVDKNPPLSSTPDTMTIHQGQSASYAITVGHVGWANQTVDLSCKTDSELGTCSMSPASVTLDGANSPTSSAFVVTTRGSIVLTPKSPAQPPPFGPLVALRILLALGTAMFLLAMARAMRRRRWAHAGNFATLTVLFGMLCAGCGGGIPGTPRGTYTVTITGTSGMTTNTVQTRLVVQ